MPNNSYHILRQRPYERPHNWYSVAAYTPVDVIRTTAIIFLFSNVFIWFVDFAFDEQDKGQETRATDRSPLVTDFIIYLFIFSKFTFRLSSQLVQSPMAHTTLLGLQSDAC